KKAMENKMIQNLESNTGKSLQVWIDIVKASGLEKHMQIIKFLKSEHGFTHGFANLVAHKARASDAGSAESLDSLVDAQYSKGKEALRPLYDKLITAIQDFGSDVEIAPKKAYVSLRRKKQFGIIQPSTKSRMDVGINLKGEEPTERLETSGSFNTMVSHRVRTSQVEDIDADLIAWLKLAYDRS
ncbi:MAG: DUF4287 domain-containing protein, partial [Bacteroidota bacterium]